MTTSTIIPTSIIVTPHKVQRSRKLQPFQQQQQPKGNLSIMTLTSNPQRFRTVEQLEHLTAERQESAQHHDKRVFRCLSNTAGTSTTPSTITSMNTSALSPDAARARRSSLKHMFLPPSSDVRRQSRQQQMSVFYGCRLDRSTMTQVPLRRSGKSRAARKPAAEGDEEPQLQVAAPTTTKKGVHFCPAVTVVCVPSHKDYATSLKRTLWGSLKDIKANAIRNTAEFIHDRCNWRKATEEDHMYRDTRSGAYIHPVHVQRYYAAWQAAKKKKQRQQQQEEEASSSDPLEPTAAGDENERTKQSETHAKEELPRSRKRVRCCSPSPIRRLQDVTADHHQPKRQRTILSPVPCRRPPTAVYQQQPQQDNSYAYYEEQQQASYWQQQQQQNTAVCAFPHHPSNVTFPPPASEMA